MTAQFRPEHREKKARGAAANVIERNERLAALAHKAIRFWERTLDDKSDATIGERIQVSKLVVEYAWGKPKQQVQVDAKVEINHRAHIEALTLLAVAANGPTGQANPMITLDNSPPGPNQTLLANPTNPSDLVGIGGLVALDLDAANAAPAAQLAEPPATPPRNPGGVFVHDNPRPLDTENGK